MTGLEQQWGKGKKKKKKRLGEGTLARKPLELENLHNQRYSGITISSLLIDSLLDRQTRLLSYNNIAIDLIRVQSELIHEIWDVIKS